MIGIYWDIFVCQKVLSNIVLSEAKPSQRTKDECGLLPLLAVALGPFHPLWQ